MTMSRMLDKMGFGEWELEWCVWWIVECGGCIQLKVEAMARGINGKSGSDGQHLFLTYSTQIQSKNILQPDVDHKRSNFTILKLFLFNL